MLLRKLSIVLTTLALALVASKAVNYLSVPPQFDDPCTDFGDCYDTAINNWNTTLDTCDSAYETAKKVCKKIPKVLKKIRKECFATAAFVHLCCTGAATLVLRGRIAFCCAWHVDDLGGGGCLTYDWVCGC